MLPSVAAELVLPSIAAEQGREPFYRGAEELESHNFSEDGDLDEEFMDVEEEVEAEHASRF